MGHIWPLLTVRYAEFKNKYIQCQFRSWKCLSGHRDNLELTTFTCMYTAWYTCMYILYTCMCTVLPGIHTCTCMLPIMQVCTVSTGHHNLLQGICYVWSLSSGVGTSPITLTPRVKKHAHTRHALKCLFSPDSR